MILPEALKPGDTVALIAPARAVSKEEMAAFKLWAEQKGLTLLEGKHLYGRKHQFSGTAEERAADLREAWLNPTVKAIFCARGGYGSVHLLEWLEDLDWLNHPKWLIGFSDITTLHLHLNNLGMATLHAPMAIHWGLERIYTQENIAAVENALFNPSITFDLQNFIRNTAASFSGKLIGGNLSLIYAALGTPEQPKTDGAVLFIEDLDEYLYHVDRMMTALKRAGILKNISALLVGGMSDMKDNAVPFGSDPETIITNCCSEYHFPIIFNFPAGHTDKNICLKLGAHCTFDGKYFKQ